MNNISSVEIGDRKIGPGHPIFIIADVGLTNGGDLKRSLMLIDMAKELGVDAIKFQMIGPEYLLGDRERTYTYPTVNDGPKTENMFEMFSALTYSSAEWKTISDYAKSTGLEFICTSHYLGAVDILEQCNVACHKICSWSVTHKRLIQKIGETGKPMFMDMGSSTQSSLLELFDWYLNSGGTNIIPLHDFHTKEISEMNFRSIESLKQNFATPVGYTSPGKSSHHDFMSIGLGVNVLEKRFTHDRTIPKNGHWKALEPDEFKDWIKTIKELELSLGTGGIKPTKSDIDTSSWAFKRLATIKDIPKGALIKDDMLDGRRSGIGISAKFIDNIIGRRTNHAIKSGTMITFEMIC
ncbi:MAG: N-acetylneuraminate synthase family protein [Desulfobacula sp.]|nr:N-acetylneuraminate synthase family protein [Desulfobacula sp.]